MTDGEVIDFNIDPQYDLGQQIFSNPFGVRPSSDPTEFEAICFFLRCNTWPGAYWTEPGKYPSLFVTSGSASQRVLEASIAASGSAMLSRINKSQPLKLAAEKHYSNALSLMASTLSDGVEARANSTLAAVLIMTLFEVRPWYPFITRC